LNRDTKSYGFNWKNYNLSYSPVLSNQYLYESFQYASTDSLNSYPYNGIYSLYPGDGYVFKLIGSNADLITNLTRLQSFNWIDRQTRAIFLETLFYNPHIDSFAYITILFEILPSGNLLKSIQIDVIKLFSDSSKVSYLLVFYLILSGFSMINEIFRIKKERLSYLKKFWNWVEILLITFSISAFVLSFNAYNNKNNALSFIQQTKGHAYLRLQHINNSYQILIICLAFALFFSIIKLIKVLRFNKKILYFIEIFKTVSFDLIFFSIGLFIGWFAFVQLMYLIINTQIMGFKSMTASIMSGLVILNGYQINELNSFEMSSLSKLIISLYYVAVLFFGISTLLTVLCFSICKAKESFEAKDKFNEISLMEVAKKKINLLAWQSVKDETASEDKNFLNEFITSINDLIYYLETVFILIYIFYNNLKYLLKNLKKIFTLKKINNRFIFNEEIREMIKSLKKTRNIENKLKEKTEKLKERRQIIIKNLQKKI